MGKKSKQDDESEDIEEGTNPSHQTDATGTDVSDEDEGTEAENNSLVYKLKKKIQSLQKGKSKAKADDDDEETSADEDVEAAKKKKKSKILQFVIVGGTAIFLLSDYIIPTEEPVAVIKPAKKGAKVKKPVAEAPAEEKPATDTAATTETPATDPATVTPSESPVDVTEAPVDNGTTPVETAPIDTTVTETPTEQPVETAPVETTPTDTTVTEAPVEQPVETTPVETAPVENTVTEDTGTGEATTPGEDNLTDQILEDLEKQAKDTQQPEQKKEYVAPPDYEYRGRGLVYNCTGKHWACVDAPSYKTCEDNASSVKFLNKKTECHPFNVYETPKGCEGVQNRMVSSSAKTAFCAE